MTSRGETLLRAYVKRCFPDHKSLYNFRDTGIINPDTGFPLEIDIYLPELRIGFEFHGRQHKTDEKQRKRDAYKRKQSKEKGIILFEIWTSTMTEDLYELIIKRVCKEKVKKPTKKFAFEFKQKAEEYKKMIYKMNQSINSGSFVRRKK